MSLIIKMDAIKTEEHLRKSIPYIMNEKKTGGLCFSNSGITSEQIVDTFFLTKQIHPTLGTRQGYHFKFSFSKDETIEAECQTAHCGRYIPHFDFGEKLSPIVPYRHLPQILSGMTADCRSLV